MRRGYIRIRKGGPDEATQRRSLITIDNIGRLYVDGPTETRKHRQMDPKDPLPERSWVLRHLNPGDEVVVHDAATLGTSVKDILATLEAIDQRYATLYVVTTNTTYRWHPQAAEIIALATSGGEVARREQTTDARKRLRQTGANRKFTSEMKIRALKLWSDNQIRSGKEVAALLHREFGVKVSLRTLYNNLPPREAAQKEHLT